MPRTSSTSLKNGKRSNIFRYICTWFFGQSTDMAFIIVCWIFPRLACMPVICRRWRLLQLPWEQIWCRNWGWAKTATLRLQLIFRSCPRWKEGRWNQGALPHSNKLIGDFNTRVGKECQLGATVVKLNLYGNIFKNEDIKHNFAAAKNIVL